MEDSTRRSRWLRRLALVAGVLVVAGAAGGFLLARADGPVGILAGGPLRTGEEVALASLDWNALDRLHELELEIVAAGRSRTLWFSAHDGAGYVACDLDCMGGRLTRWPQQIERDDRVVIRIDGRRADARLVHVPHGTPEYEAVRAGRARKYAGDEGGRAAAETAAHEAVVEVGEVLTGRAAKSEPGDRLYRIAPRD
ncbi:MAG: hypothetical protein R3E88_13905 [Myxococcota bacterium]